MASATKPARSLPLLALGTLALFAQAGDGEARPLTVTDLRAWTDAGRTLAPDDLGTPLPNGLTLALAPGGGLDPDAFDRAKWLSGGEMDLADYLPGLRAALAAGDLALYEDLRAELLFGFDDFDGQLLPMLDWADARFDFLGADGADMMDAEAWARYDPMESRCRAAYGLPPRAAKPTYALTILEGAR